MSKDKERNEGAERVWARLEESLLKASDDEILEDVRSEGYDPEKRAADIRALLVKTSKDFGKKKLLQARNEYERVISQSLSNRYELPDTTQERRALFISTITDRPDLKEITIQHRDFSGLSDEDIESCLQILIELGVFQKK